MWWRYDAEHELLELVQADDGISQHVRLTRREVALLDRYIHAQGLHGLSE